MSWHQPFRALRRRSPICRAVLCEHSLKWPELAPPPKPEWRWQWPLGLLGGGILLLITGTVLWGLLLLLAGVAAGYIAHGQYTAAQIARAAWEQLLYCRHCAVTFDRAALKLG